MNAKSERLKPLRFGVLSVVFYVSAGVPSLWAFRTAEWGYLVVLYGLKEIHAQHLSIIRSKPTLMVSNGDVASELQTLCVGLQ